MEAPAPPCGDKPERGFDPVDRLSLMPGDVVFNILSRLSFKEAVITSILSRKWRYSWRFFSGFMDFDASEMSHMESYWFVSWVNRVLRSHKASTLQGFEVSFIPDNDSQCEIDSWIKFALQKRVEHLELDLTNSDHPTAAFTYVFPSNLNFLCESNFNSLKSLRLSSVDVNGDVLQHLLLSCCPNLEHLTVSDSPSLVSLKVFGVSLKLKRLEVISCFELKELDVSAVSLLSFGYYGSDISIPFSNVPNLVEVSLGGSCSHSIVDYLRQFSDFNLKIETFKLDLGSSYLFRRDFPRNFPTLSYVRHLEVAAAVFTHESSLLSPCAALLKACPLVHTFILEILYEVPGFITFFSEITEDHALTSLKVVKVFGFLGNFAEVNMVQYLLRNAVVLEKMIIFVEHETEKFESVMQCALDLRRISPMVEFVVQ